MTRIEIPKFMGKWYVIANIPTFLEIGAHNATESYQWNAKKELIEVDFRFNQGAPKGRLIKIPQKAFIHDQKTKAEWRIQLFWPFKSAYLILFIAKDDSTTIVGVPNKKHVWIMARKPHLSPVVYNKLVAKVKILGYDIAKLQKVPQKK